VDGWDDVVMPADAKIPITVITNRPDDYSSDTSIAFTCDEAVCVFEYQLLDEYGENGPLDVLRNWSLVMSPLNFKDWMHRGRHTIQVRNTYCGVWLLRNRICVSVSFLSACEVRGQQQHWPGFRNSRLYGGTGPSN
jgi:hypothetical protein